MVENGPGQHGHERTGNAMTGAVHHTEQVAAPAGAEKVEVAAYRVPRPPQYAVMMLEMQSQLAVGQNGALDEAGVVDGVVELLLGGGHLGIGQLEGAGTLPHFFFQLTGVALYLVGHVRKGLGQLADLVVARGR